MGFFNQLFGSNKIRVTFIDNASGNVFIETSMTLEELPEDFSIETTMHLNGADWKVEEATPSHTSDFSQTKRLTLKLRKLEKVDPSKILFTVPTISNEFPQFTPRSRYNAFETLIREDDWRQNEFVKKRSSELVELEFKKIKDIWSNESMEVDEQFTAFKKCHVRNMIGEPKLSIPLNEIQAELGTSKIGSLKINTEFVANGFSMQTENTCFYGIISNDLIAVLGVSQFNEGSVYEFKRLIDRFGLIFVNWSHAQLVD